VPFATSAGAASSHPAPISPIPSTLAACDAPEINVTSDFKRDFYTVDGGTVGEINESIKKNGPRGSDGELAVGLTDYDIKMSGRRCEAPDSCWIGSMNIAVNGTITLPTILDPSMFNPSFLVVWNGFVDKISTHEGRHVTIVTEGAEEMKRQLFELGAMPCPALDSAIDRIWRLETEAIERRQAAFHTADSQGSGGLVAR
jgi:predicted secreted Zn-dependent protease